MKTNNSHVAVVVIVLAFITGCRRDMQDQPKFRPLQAGSLRAIPAGTVARDELNDNDLFHTGLTNGNWTDTIPLSIDVAVLHRGQQRYDIFCSPCHSRTGDGDGMVARRGFRRPADLNTDRVRQEPPGYLFEVIASGYGAMPDYADQIPPGDRWAIVAYLRALQLSRHATLGDVPPGSQP